MTPSTNIRVSVQNMSCASCVGRVERALAAVPGVDAVNVNLASETAQAQIDSDTRVPAVIDALERAGYPARTGTVRLNIASMSCASCGASLFSECPDCGKIRHHLLPHCRHCGAETERWRTLGRPVPEP